MRCASLAGFTVVEMLVVIVIIGILAGLLMSGLSSAKPRADRLRCVGHLKQIAAACKTFAVDHDSKFPWRISAAEATGPTDWLALTNYLQARVLRSPCDTGRFPAPSWTAFTPTNHCSYFYASGADELQPSTILAGTRNISSTHITITGMRWASDVMGGMSTGHGNAALSDGSASQMNHIDLQRQALAHLGALGALTDTLVLPEASGHSLR
jgi:prepilin-type N-terminal cleavage/methylation domain-containing protein